MTLAFETGALDAPPPSRPLWLMAAIVAIGLHAGAAALAFLAAVPEDSDDDVGAPAIEIALDMTAPKVEQTDLPPGPEAEASAASPAVQEQQKQVEETQRPVDEPTETETPDRVVSQEPQQKPQDEKPEVSQIQATPSAAAVASEAAAPTPSDTAKEAPAVAAPVQGLGAAAQRIRAAWQKRLVAHLDRNKRYPPGDARRNAEALVNFTLDRLGHVVAAGIAKSSGDPAFDQAALAMMRRADPVPAPPPLIADEQLTFVVPVVFRAQRR